MEGERHPARRVLGAVRDQVIEHLSEAFAKDELGVDEFEARIDGAYRASTEEGLRALVKDLSSHPVSIGTHISDESPEPMGTDTPAPTKVAAAE